MHTRIPSLVRRTQLALLAGLIALPLSLAACDESKSTEKSTTTKTVDTPEGKKKVTESTETTTTTEKK